MIIDSLILVHTPTHTHTHTQELLKCCVGRCADQLEPLDLAPPTGEKEGGKRKRGALSMKADKMDPVVGSIQAAFR